MQACAYAVIFGVDGGDMQSGEGNIQSQGTRIRAVIEERDGDAARTRADIADEGRAGLFQEIEGGLNQQLGFGARDEHIGRDHEIEAVKFLPSGDVLQRLALRAARDHFAVTGARLRCERFVGMRDEKRAVAFERMREKRAGFASRFCYASAAQHGGSLQKSLRDG